MVGRTAVLCARYFRRYLEKHTFQGYRYWRPLRGWVTVKYNNRIHYGEHRPWTQDFKDENTPGRLPPQVLVEPIKEWSIFNGDRVEILVGKDKGKQGLINSIIKERNWCYVEGLNCDFEETKLPIGDKVVIQKKEKPLLLTSQVKLVDPQDEKPTDIEWRFTEKGERVRVSARTGRIVPLPAKAAMLEDFIVPDQYKEQDKDTLQKELTKVTFKPKLKTFEQDIMDQMGIKEDRKKAKTYWY